MTHSQGKRVARYPKVKATNGAVFELRARMMKQIGDVNASVGWAGLRFSATPAAVRAAMTKGYIVVRCIVGGQIGAIDTYVTQRQAGSALALGCMNFNKSDATKIRQWAKGAKRGK